MFYFHKDQGIIDKSTSRRKWFVFTFNQKRSSRDKEKWNMRGKGNVELNEAVKQCHSTHCYCPQAHEIASVKLLF